MATLEKQGNLSDSHWYTRNGQPAYTIKKKDGGDRPATLRDARKHNLLPSVTTIFNIMAKPQLDKWKLAKAVQAALTTTRDDGEPDDRYHQRILERSRSEVSEAAELGTRIHDAIEAAFGGQEPPGDLKPYVQPTMKYLIELHLQNIRLEDVVVNQSEGYAGRVDLMADFNGIPIVIDFKTRKTKKGERVAPYEFQSMQIAAYARAAFGSLNHVWGANLYISTTEPERVEVVSYKPHELRKEYEAFQHMCALWRYSKNYDPRS
jgi:hypothetical protein